jgi:predicted transcriptional regulator
MSQATTKKACRKRSGDDAKPCSVTMPKALQEAIIRRADAEDRSFSATVRQALEKYLARPA